MIKAPLWAPQVSTFVGTLPRTVRHINSLVQSLVQTFGPTLANSICFTMEKRPPRIIYLLAQTCSLSHRFYLIRAILPRPGQGGQSQVNLTSNSLSSVLVLRWLWTDINPSKALKALTSKCTSEGARWVRTFQALWTRHKLKLPHQHLSLSLWRIKSTFSAC